MWFDEYPKQNVQARYDKFTGIEAEDFLPSPSIYDRDIIIEECF